MSPLYKEDQLQHSRLALTDEQIANFAEHLTEEPTADNLVVFILGSSAVRDLERTESS
jgi:hypothetical protein